MDSALGARVARGGWWVGVGMPSKPSAPSRTLSIASKLPFTRAPPDRRNLYDSTLQRYRLSPLPWEHAAFIVHLSPCRACVQGLAPNRAWQTADKALQTGSGTYPAGTYLLFKRGTRYDNLGEGDWVRAEPSTEEAPFVIGSYGEASLADPVLDVSLGVYGEHVTIRDLELHRVALYGSHFLLYRCTVHSMGSEPEHRESNNLVAMASEASYCAVVECLVYDCPSNDHISIHDNFRDGVAVPVGSHHWVVDNVIIGNSGAEQGFDFASGGSHSDDYEAAFDVKFINNRIQCQSVPALSQLNGSMTGGIVAGKKSAFVWLLNNTVTGCRSYGLSSGGYNRASSGNILYDAGTANNVMMSITTMQGAGVVTHNTVLQTRYARSPVWIVEPTGRVRTDVRLRFSHNIVGYELHNGLADGTRGGSTNVKVDLPTDVFTIVEFDYNFYQHLGAGSAWDARPTDGHPIPKVVRSDQHGDRYGLNLSEWQEESSLDAHSGDGDVPGVTVPDRELWLDPRDWSDPAFMAHFTPDPAWSGCAGADTPGAVDCAGKRLGVMEPFEEFAENDGLGWAGPPIIRERYPLLHVATPPPTSPPGMCEGEPATSFCLGVRQYWGTAPVISPAPKPL